MRIGTLVVLAATLLAVTPSTGSAQDKRVHINLGGGPTFISGDLGEHFASGWGPAIGVTFDTSERIGIQFEYAYRFFDIKDDAPFFAATTFDANHQTHQLDFNLVASLTGSDSAVRPYIVAGPGMYYRSVEITEYVGNGIICDPYYYICGTYPVDAVVGERGGWDFGFNVGGGVGFAIGEDAELFVETRYHYVAGPDIQSNTATPSGSTAAGGSTSGSYWPLTFGFRF
jgi:opacity protein-like surface antigen